MNELNTAIYRAIRTGELDAEYIMREQLRADEQRRPISHEAISHVWEAVPESEDYDTPDVITAVFDMYYRNAEDMYENAIESAYELTEN